MKDPQGRTNRIRAACTAKNWKLVDLARAIKVEPQTITRLLRGKVDKSKHFSSIADALDVSVNWLNTGDPTKAPSWSVNFITRQELLPPLPEELLACLAKILKLPIDEVRESAGKKLGRRMLIEIITTRLLPPANERVSSRLEHP